MLYPTTIRGLRGSIDVLAQGDSGAIVTLHYEEREARITPTRLELVYMWIPALNAPRYIDADLGKLRVRKEDVGENNALVILRPVVFSVAERLVFTREQIRQLVAALREE